MSKVWCIKPDILQNLQAKAREQVDGVGYFDTLGTVSSEERFAMWNSVVNDTTLAHQINGEFEAALASSKPDALKNVMERIFLGKNITKLPQSTLDKINKLDEMGALGDEFGDGFLYDLVADTLEVSLTPDQVGELRRRHERLEELIEKSDDMGLVVDEYFDELSGLHKYVNSLNPSPIYDVIIENTRRSALLFNTNSPVVNFIGNTVMGGHMAVNRRMDSWKWKGESGDLLLAYAKKVNRIYFKTGWDLTRIVDMSHQAEIKGETPTHSEGPGALRKYTRWMGDVVFGKLMNDTPFATLAWCDYVDLNSVAIAKAEGKTGADIRTRARELVMDAMQLAPEPGSPAALLKQAGTDAALVATFNANDKAAKLSNDVRVAVNKALPGVGTFISPFVRTVANLVEYNIDASGMGFARGVVGIRDAMQLIKNGDTAAGNRAFREAYQHMINAGTGMVFSFIIASLADPDDFVGIWDFLDPKQKGLAAIKNAPPNTVRIGGSYVSLDYFGPYAAAITGFMYWRKYSDGSVVDGAWQYARGAGMQGLRLPGTATFVDWINGVVKAFAQEDMNKAWAGSLGETIAAAGSTFIPAVVSQAGRATDPYQRVIPQGDILAPLKSVIPGWRTTLQPKVNEVTGNLKASEDWLSTLLFGRRVTTAEDSPVVKEISRLAKAGQMPTITNLEYQTDKIVELREKIKVKYPGKAGEDAFTAILQEFGQKYHADMLLTMKTKVYKGSTDEQKKELFNAARSKWVEYVVNMNTVKLKLLTTKGK